MTISKMVPFLCCSNATAAIEFYQAVFAAEVKLLLQAPDGRVGHCELSIGALELMLSDEWPEFGMSGPTGDQIAASSIHLMVDDADALVELAVANGASVLFPLEDQFYGERSGRICDPFGHEWLIGQFLEEVQPNEMQSRFNQMMAALTETDEAE